MKSVKSILLCIVLVIGILFVGCNQNAPTDDGDSGTSVETSAASKKVLNFMGPKMRYEGQEEAWNEMIKEFEAENNCTIKTRWQGTWTEVTQALSTAQLAGENIDLITVNGGIVRASLAPSGILMNITDIVEPIKDRFVEGMIDHYTVGGKVWGFPYGESTTSLIYYNMNIFEELGISEPKTFEEMVDIAKIIKDKKDITPMIHQGKVPWYWPMWYFETYGQVSGNKSVENITEFLSGNRKFTGEAEKEAFLKIKAFFDSGILSLDSLDTDSDAMRATFAQQKAAMFYGGTWEYAPTLSAVDGAFEIGVFEFPLIVNTQGVKPQHGGAADDGIAIPSCANPDNMDLIVKFVEYMTRPENADRAIQPFNPMIPSVKGVKSQSTQIANKMNKEFIPNTVMFLDWIWSPEINDAFCQAIPAVVSGYVTADEAVETVQKAYDTLVLEKEYSYDWYNKWDDEDWAKVTPKLTKK